MGIIVQGKGLWNALFTRTQRQLLGLFFGYPDRSFYANEIVRRAKVGTGSVQRELAKLAGSGLVTVAKVGNQKHYQANRESPIFPELRGIVLKTFGATEQLRRAVIELPGNVELAVLFGDEGQTPASAINMLLVSDDLDYADVVTKFTETENRIGRTVQPILFESAEFQEMKQQGNARLQEILQRPKVVLKGSLD
jgi:hypothetical protein